jgi:tetratricopeptide (TPR) repeat protein
VALYEQALALDPKDLEAPPAHNNLGALLLAQGETERALEHFEAARKAAPYNLESRYNAALIYLDQGRVAEAILLLEEAAKLQPNHEQVNLRLGFAYLAADRGQDAYKSLLLVRRLYPVNWAATLGLAVLHARAQELDTAKELLAQALEQGGEDARAAAAGFPILNELLAQ